MASLWESITASAWFWKKADIEEALLPPLSAEKASEEGGSEENSHGGPSVPQSKTREIIRDKLLSEEGSKVSFLPAITVLGLYVGIGFLCYWSLYGQIGGTKTDSVVDSLYFSVVTLTTVGYGGA